MHHECLRGEALERSDVLIHVASYAVPVALCYMLQLLAQTAVLTDAAARLNSTEQRSYVLAIVAVNLIAMPVCSGFLTCVDTLCSQAHGRAPDSGEIGLITLRACLAVVAVCVPLSAFLVYAVGPLLQYLQPGGVGDGAAQYLAYAPLYVLVMSLAMVVQRTLQAQGAAHLVLVGYVMSTGLTPRYAQHLVVAGDASTWVLTNVATAGTLLVCLVVVALFFPSSRANRLPSDFTFASLFARDEMAELVRLGAWGSVACASSWWGYMAVLAVVVKTHAPQALDAFVVGGNVLLLTMSAVQGVSSTIAVAVGTELGAGRPQHARAWVRALGHAALAVMVFDAVVVLLFCRDLAKLYTRDVDVQQAVCASWVLLLAYHVADAQQLSTQAAFWGAGEQRRAARIVVLTVWCVVVPLGSAVTVWASPDRDQAFPAALSVFTLGALLTLCALKCNRAFWNWNELATVASSKFEQKMQKSADSAMAVDELW